MRGAVAAAHERGLTVALTSLSEGTERHSWFDHVTSRGTRGVILLLSRLSGYQKAELRSRRLAFAVVDPGGQPDPDVPTVGATNWSGGLSATRHLIELGHHRIGVIGGRRDLLCSRARMDGYRSAMEAAGLPVNPRLIRLGGFPRRRRLQAGADSARVSRAAHGNLLRERPAGVGRSGGCTSAPPSGPVPTDLSLVGFDDLPLSSWTSPPLTTVRQPLAEMAATAVRLVLAQGRGEEEEKGANRSVELATSLVVRESTAPPCR